MNNKLKDFLIERGYTQAYLAKELEYTQPYISALLLGKVPISDSFLFRFGKRFGHSVADGLMAVSSEGGDNGKET